MPACGYEFFSSVNLFTSGHVMFCLLYKHTNDDFFYDFPNISEHFPKISGEFPKVKRKYKWLLGYSMVYHERALYNYFIPCYKTFAQRKTGRLDVITSKIQRLSCFLIGCIFYGMVKNVQ